MAKVSSTDLCNGPQTLIPTLVNAPDNLLSRDLRIEMCVAGRTRRIPTKIMPAPDDPAIMVIVTRAPETQELVPAKRRGAKRVVERNRDGYWAEVR